MTEREMSDLWGRLEQLCRRGGTALLSGLAGSAKSFFLHMLARQVGRALLAVVPSAEQAHDLAGELKTFLGPEAVLLFLPRDMACAEARSAGSFAGLNRVLTLNALAAHPQRRNVVVAAAGSLLSALPTPQSLAGKTLVLRRGEVLELDAALRTLVELGYERVTTVEAPGTFALRGGILDLYPPGAAAPVRAEFFGDEIESLRRFDVNTQRSGAALQSLQVGWADERAFPPGQAHLLDHVPAGGVVFIDEVREVQATLERDLRRARAFAAAAGRETPLLTWEAAQQRLQGRPLLYHSLFPSVLPGVKAELVQHITQREMEPLYASPDALGNRLREWAAQGIAVSIAVRGSREEARVRQELQRLGVTLPVTFAPWDVERGFVSPTLGMALVSSRDLWGRRAAGGRRRPRGAPALGPAELKVGDYVVHENHGVGLFQGMTRMEVDGVSREYVIIQYAGTDRLYLPVDKLDLLSRYSSTDERQPRLSRLGGSDWERTKKRVRESVREMAQELLQLYARRQAQPGYAFSPDTVWQAEFEAAFEHEETPDQARAVAEIKRDMEAPRPMDRLVCGDVGYGKTEVALRAAFKAVMDHKQVAILVPTTVLAEQHYQTCRQRFGGYPVVVEALSRFRTPQQQKAILAQLQRGVVDVIIGTHRLLSRDVRFKDLGLLIVDEEHRFGVRQKERIKALKSSVDVLSLSATPIPRTLHMALTGLRDLSVIATPPPERYPITTYVMEYHEEILREAIMAEIERGGQVFAVHNRIQDIGAFRDRLAAAVPRARMEVAHARMPDEELASVMRRFLAREFDVLVCTTIIESGLDMPNVNTLVVDEADRLGLAQLYQLRGRVGRGRRLAYAYLTYRPDRAMGEAAQKRLRAIHEFTELGSGLKIALRDLEIRGAGNILGPQQHGHISAVGFDLYLRLLEEETARLRGEETKPSGLPAVELKVDFYLPDEYIADPAVKMQVYRRLLMASSAGELVSLRAELEDRFGPLPPAVDNLLRVARLRLHAATKEIKSIQAVEGRAEITLRHPRRSGPAPDSVLGTLGSWTDGTTLVVPLRDGDALEKLEQVLAAL